MILEPTRLAAPKVPLTGLSEYAIDARHGFLPAQDPVDALPDYYQPWEQAGRTIGALIMTGQLRKTVEQMPVLAIDKLDTDQPDTDQLGSGAYQERAMLLLCCLANAYVWGDETPATTLPAPVARPLHALAAVLDRPPIVAHASIVLNNWRRLDASEPLSLSNIDTQLTFLGGVDEKWFYLATVGVELVGAPALPLLVTAQHAAAAGDAARLTAALRGVTDVVDQVADAFLDIERWCDNYVFYHRVRPFLAGWPAPGLSFEGVDCEPLALAGGSAAQSSLIQAFDAGLDIRHTDDLTRGFLGRMRAHMPAPHRRFLEDLSAGPSVREFVASSQAADPQLSDAYNAAVTALARLRTLHIGITGRYIRRFENTGDAAKGTGGTGFVHFLKKSREETMEGLLP